MFPYELKLESFVGLFLSDNAGWRDDWRRGSDISDFLLDKTINVILQVTPSLDNLLEMGRTPCAENRHLES